MHPNTHIEGKTLIISIRLNNINQRDTYKIEIKIMVNYLQSMAQ